MIILLEKHDHYSITLETKDLDNLWLGKKLIDYIKDDVTAGTDKTGHAKYRKILEAYGILTNSDLAEWRLKYAVIEKDPISLSP